jgi:hypothetical protein
MIAVRAVMAVAMMTVMVMVMTRMKFVSVAVESFASFISLVGAGLFSVEAVVFYIFVRRSFRERLANLVV